MKTYSLPGSLSKSRAMQEIFLLTHISMIPRRDSNGNWLYDEPGKAELEKAKKQSIFTNMEAEMIFNLCSAQFDSPFLWQGLVHLIKSFPHQDRFRYPTFHQVHLIAGSFYWFTLSRINKN